MKEVLKIQGSPATAVSVDINEDIEEKVEEETAVHRVGFMDNDVIEEIEESIESLLATLQGRSESGQWVRRTFKHALTQCNLLNMIHDDNSSTDLT